MGGEARLRGVAIFAVVETEHRRGDENKKSVCVCFYVLWFYRKRTVHGRPTPTAMSEMACSTDARTTMELLREPARLPPTRLFAPVVSSDDDAGAAADTRTTPTRTRPEPVVMVAPRGMAGRATAPPHSIAADIVGGRHSRQPRGTDGGGGRGRRGEVGGHEGMEVR